MRFLCDKDDIVTGGTVHESAGAKYQNGRIWVSGDGGGDTAMFASTSNLVANDTNYRDIPIRLQPFSSMLSYVKLSQP